MSLKKNTLWNLAGSGVPLLAAVFAIPYLLQTLGAVGFGILALVWALIGYFSVFDFGVGRALTYELGKRTGSDAATLAPFVRAGVALTVLTGVAGAGLIALLAEPLSSRWLGITAPWQADARLAFLIAAVGIVPTTLVSGLRGALEGLDRFRASNTNRAVLGALMFALPALAVAIHGPQIWMAALYMVVARLMAALVMVCQVCPQLRGGMAIGKVHLSALLNYGVWVTVSGIVGPLMVVGDRFFVSAAVGAALLAQYAIPQEGLQRLLLIPAALCGAWLPQLAAQSLVQVRVAYGEVFRRVAFWMLAVCILAGMLAYPVLSWWLSPDFASSALPVVLVLTLGIWLNSMALVPYTVMHALGQPKTTAIFHLFELLVYAGLLWLLTRSYGLLGAALAWTGRVALDLLLLRLATAKILRFSHE